MGNQAASKEEVETQYVFEGQIGKGNYATVHRVTRISDGRVFAIKCIRKAKLDARELKFVTDESMIMRKLNHPNIVRLYEIFEDEAKIYLVLDLCEGGTLFDKVVRDRKMSERDAARVVKQVASALYYCHQIGVVHRDMKPENLLLAHDTANAVVKITDFGLAKYIKKTELMGTCCGSPNFVAPEIIVGTAYTDAVDMWSLGVTLYILLAGYRPFENASPQVLFSMIKHGKFTFHSKYWSKVSSLAKDLIKRLLVVDPTQRLSAKEVLLHPWVTGGQAPTRPLDDEHHKRLLVSRARDHLRLAVKAVVVMCRFQFLVKMSRHQWKSVYDVPTMRMPVQPQEIEQEREERAHHVEKLEELRRARSQSAAAQVIGNGARRKSLRELRAERVQAMGSPANDVRKARVSLGQEPIQSSMSPSSSPEKKENNHHQDNDDGNQQPPNNNSSSNKLSVNTIPKQRVKTATGAAVPAVPGRAPPPPRGQWACAACTFLNHPSLRQCEICETDRPNMGGGGGGGGAGGGGANRKKAPAAAASAQRGSRASAPHSTPRGAAAAAAAAAPEVANQHGQDFVNLQEERVQETLALLKRLRSESAGNRVAAMRHEHGGDDGGAGGGGAGAYEPAAAGRKELPKKTSLRELRARKLTELKRRTSQSQLDGSS